MVGANLIDLMQRVVDLLVRMIGEEAAHARRQVAWFAAGAVLLGVALAFVAGAAVEALAPLLPSRSLRLLTIAVPLALGGRALLQRGIARSATEQGDRQGDHRQHEQNVDPRAQRVAADHGQQPQDEQERRQQPQHGS
jgi:hypothetical protein